MNKILIIAAHPDDEVLGCGGTIAKLTKRGDKVFCLFLGSGKGSRFLDKQSPELKKEQLTLRKEAAAVAKILGIGKIFFEDFPDQQYDTVPFLNIVKAIEKIKNTIKPDIVFTHHYGDLNLDHRLTFQAVITATRPLQNESVKSIYSFEIASATEWGSYNKENYFIPNIFMDIADTFNKKIQALKAYKTEIRNYPHPRSIESLEIIAKRWGTVVGKEKIEAFELIREIRK